MAPTLIIDNPHAANFNIGWFYSFNNRKYPFINVLAMIGIKLALLHKNLPPHMKRHFLFISFTCLVLFFNLTSFSPDTYSSLVTDVLTHTNKFRKSKRLAVLIINDELSAIAQKHSADMARGRVGFGHGGFSKRNKMAKKAIHPLNRFAENVAYGATSGKQVVTGWKNSTPHRRNMLGRYKYIGIGIAKDRRGRIYYTQLFAG